MPRKTDTADRLLQLAKHQLHERGEQGLRVSELCEEVGVPVTSLYHFFGSREGLVERAYAEMYVQRLREDLEALRAAARETPDVAAFRALVYGNLVSFVSAERDELRWRRAGIVGAAYRRPGLQRAISEVQNAFCREMGETIRWAQGKGWVRADLHPEAFVAWFEGTLLGQTLVQLDGGDVSSEEWMTVCAQAVFAVVFGVAPGTPLP